MQCDHDAAPAADRSNVIDRVSAVATGMFESVFGDLGRAAVAA